MDPDRTADVDVLKQIVGRLRRDIVRYALAVILPAVFSVAAAAVFTRIFDPGAYGVYSIVLAAASTAILIAGGWLQQSVIRYLPRHRESGDLDIFTGKLRPTLWFVLGAIVVLATAGFFILRPLLTGYGSFYLSGAALVSTWTAFLVLNSVYQANLQPTRFAVHQVAQATLRLGLALAFIFFVSRDVLWLIVAAALSYLLPIPWMMPAASKRHAVDGAFVRTLAAYGLPVVGWTMASTVLDVSDRFIIGWLRGTGEVGIYAANYNLSKMLVTFVGVPIIMAAEPLIMNAWERGDRDRIGEIIRAFSRYFLLIVTPVVVFMCIYARSVAGILFGEAFHEGARVVTVVLPGLAIWTFGNFGTKGLKLAERTRMMLGLVLICAALNVALNFAAVPRFGYYGAAWTTLISFALYPLLVFRQTRALVPWSIPWRSVVRVGLAATITGAGWLLALTVVSPGPIGLAALGVSGLVIYGLMLHIFRELNLGRLVHGILSRT